ncbi:hypothetical protein ABIB90_005991 [Bradyrhizobium sp. JR4.1]
MIRKSVQRLSEEIMLKQLGQNAMTILISSRFRKF